MDVQEAVPLLASARNQLETNRNEISAREAQAAQVQNQLQSQSRALQSQQSLRTSDLNALRTRNINLQNIQSNQANVEQYKSELKTAKENLNQYESNILAPAEAELKNIQQQQADYQEALSWYNSGSNTPISSLSTKQARDYASDLEAARLDYTVLQSRLDRVNAGQNQLSDFYTPKEIAALNIKTIKSGNILNPSEDINQINIPANEFVGPIKPQQVSTVGTFQNGVYQGEVQPAKSGGFSQNLDKALQVIFPTSYGYTQEKRQAAVTAMGLAASAGTAGLVELGALGASAPIFGVSGEGIAGGSQTINAGKTFLTLAPLSVGGATPIVESLKNVGERARYTSPNIIGQTSGAVLSQGVNLIPTTPTEYAKSYGVIKGFEAVPNIAQTGINAALIGTGTYQTISGQTPEAKAAGLINLGMGGVGSGFEVAKIFKPEITLIPKKVEIKELPEISVTNPTANLISYSPKGESVTTSIFDVGAIGREASVGTQTQVLKQTPIRKLFKLEPKEIFSGDTYNKVEYNKAIKELKKAGYTEAQAREELRQVQPKLIEPNLKAEANVIFGEGNPIVNLEGTQTIIPKKVQIEGMNTRIFKPQSNEVLVSGEVIAGKGDVDFVKTQVKVNKRYLTSNKENAGIFQELKQQGRTTDTYEQLTAIKPFKDIDLNIPTSKVEVKNNEPQVLFDYERKSLNKAKDTSLELFRNLDVDLSTTVSSTKKLFESTRTSKPSFDISGNIGIKKEDVLTVEFEKPSNIKSEFFVKKGGKPKKENIKLFHGTTESSAKSILDTGLKPQGELKEVYLANTPEEVAGFAARKSIKTNERPVIIEANIPSDIFEGLKTNRNTGKGGVSETVLKQVPKKYLKVYDELNKEAIKSTAQVAEQRREYFNELKNRKPEQLLSDARKSMEKIKSQIEFSQSKKNYNKPVELIKAGIKQGEEFNIVKAKAYGIKAEEIVKASVPKIKSEIRSIEKKPVIIEKTMFQTGISSKDMLSGLEVKSNLPVIKERSMFVISPKSSASVKSSVEGKVNTKTNTNEKTNSIQKNNQLNNQKSNQDQLSLQLQQQNQRTEQVSVFTSTQRTRSKQEETPSGKKTPRLLIPSLEDNANKKRKKITNLIKRNKAYRVQIRRKGKFFDITKPLPIGRAELLGVKRTTSDLSRTFRLIESGTTDLSDINYKPSSQIFRAPKKSVGTPLAFVQKNALSAGSEISEIQRARRLKKYKKIKIL